MAFDPDTRSAQIDDFLSRHGWGGATRVSLGQDASTRRYERLLGPNGARAMLMDAPGRGEDPPCHPDWDETRRLKEGWNASSRLAASRVEAFAPIAGFLASQGYSSPRVEAHESATGLAIIEDLGDDLFARILEAGSADEIELYTAAGALLADLHRRPSPNQVEAGGDSWPILGFDRLALAVNADLFRDWMPRFEPDMDRSDAALARLTDAAGALIEQVLTFPTALTLRDYHAENLIWLPQRSGHARIGLLDFQDAVNGPSIWDHSMLLHDARRDVSPAARAAAVRSYLDATGGSEADFSHQLAVAGAINILRILGVFARLVARDGRPRYRTFMPRMWGHLAETMAHPAAADMAGALDSILPGWRSRAA